MKLHYRSGSRISYPSKYSTIESPQYLYCTVGLCGSSRGTPERNLAVAVAVNYLLHAHRLLSCVWRALFLWLEFLSFMTSAAATAAAAAAATALVY